MERQKELNLTHSEFLRLLQKFNGTFTKLDSFSKEGNARDPGRQFLVLYRWTQKKEKETNFKELSITIIPAAPTLFTIAKHASGSQ